jgi:hypothetical protein
VELLGGPIGERLWLLLLGVEVLLLACIPLARRIPAEKWNDTRLASRAFFAGLAIHLGVLLWLSLWPLHIDVDTVAQANAVLRAESLEGALAARSYWVVSNILETPLLYGLDRILPFGPVGVFRLLAFVGAAISALVLRSAAGKLGASPWAANFAGLLPLATHGSAWLTLTLEPTSLERWDMLAGGAGLLVAVALGPPGPRPFGRRAAVAVYTGLLALQFFALQFYVRWTPVD